MKCPQIDMFDTFKWWPKAKSFRISVNLKNIAFKFKKNCEDFFQNSFLNFYLHLTPTSLSPIPSYEGLFVPGNGCFFAYITAFLLVAFVCNVSHLPKAGQHLSKRCHNLLLWCPEIQKHYSTASASANHSTTGISSCGMICRCSSTSQQYPANSNKWTLLI